MFRKLLVLLAALLIGFFGYVAMLPSENVVERSAVLPAAPAAVFAKVDSLKSWNEWSPWAKLDPKATATFSGPEKGPGAEMAWAGNSDVGKGKMTIVESVPNERVKLKLDFEEPMRGTSIATFDFAPEGSGTRVSWSMVGEQPFLARALCVLFRGNQMVGRMFEQGLAALGAAASRT